MKKQKRLFWKTIKEIWIAEKYSVIRIISFGSMFISFILMLTCFVNLVINLPTLNIPFLVVAIIGVLGLIASVITGIYFEIAHNKKS